MYIKYFLCNHILFLIMHNGYPVRAMKKQRKSYVVFLGNTGIPEE